MLGEPELVHIKGAEDPSPRVDYSPWGHARRLGLTSRLWWVADWKSARSSGLVEKSITGGSCVVGVVGLAGIGKTRIVKEAVDFARSRGVEVFSTFCESHATDIPFGVVARMLSAIAGVSGLDSETARARIRQQIPESDPQDLSLLDDLLGIADPAVPQPNIEADARRRRLNCHDQHRSTGPYRAGPLRH